MRRKPITKPIFNGCGNCSNIPISIIKEDDFICDYNLMEGYINSKYIDSDSLIEITVNEFIKKYNIKKDDFVELYYMSAFHDEVYELDTEDMAFKLVEQGQGYA